MNVMEAIRKRRAISDFEARPVPEAVLREVVEAGYLAPTGGNNPSRELVVVTDREQLQRLSQAHQHCRWLAGAAAAIAIVGNPAKSRYWVEDGSVVGAQIWLAAVEQGLGVGWGAMYQSDNAQESARREQHCRDILGIPESLRVLAVLAVGYPAAVPPPKAKPPFEQVVHWGRYGQH